MTIDDRVDGQKMGKADIKQLNVYARTAVEAVDVLMDISQANTGKGTLCVTDAMAMLAAINASADAIRERIIKEVSSTDTMKAADTSMQYMEMYDSIFKGVKG